MNPLISVNRENRDCHSSGNSLHVDKGSIASVRRVPEQVRFTSHGGQDCAPQKTTRCANGGGITTDSVFDLRRRSFLPGPRPGRPP